MKWIIFSLLSISFYLHTSFGAENKNSDHTTKKAIVLSFSNSNKDYFLNEDAIRVSQALSKLNWGVSLYLSKNAFTETQKQKLLTQNTMAKIDESALMLTHLLEVLDQLISENDSNLKQLILYMSGHGTEPYELAAGHILGSGTVNASALIEINKRLEILYQRKIKILFFDPGCYSGASTYSYLKKSACVLSTQNSKNLGYARDLLLSAPFLESLKEKNSVIDLYETMIRQTSFSSFIKNSSDPIFMLPMISGVNLKDEDFSYWLFMQKDKDYIKNDPTRISNYLDAFKAFNRIETSLGKKEAYLEYLKSTRAHGADSRLLRRMVDYNEYQKLQKILPEPALVPKPFTPTEDLLKNLFSPFNDLTKQYAFKAEGTKLFRSYILNLLQFNFNVNILNADDTNFKGTFQSQPDLFIEQTLLNLPTFIRFANYMSTTESRKVEKALTLIYDQLQSKNQLKADEMKAIFLNFFDELNKSPEFSPFMEWRSNVEKRMKILSQMNEKTSSDKMDDSYSKKDFEFIEDIFTSALQKVRSREGTFKQYPAIEGDFRNCIDFQF